METTDCDEVVVDEHEGVFEVFVQRDQCRFLQSPCFVFDRGSGIRQEGLEMSNALSKKSRLERESR